jgi:hypothetical protein
VPYNSNHLLASFPHQPTAKPRAYIKVGLLYSVSQMGVSAWDLTSLQIERNRMCSCIRFTTSEPGLPCWTSHSSLRIALLANRRVSTIAAQCSGLPKKVREARHHWMVNEQENRSTPKKYIQGKNRWPSQIRERDSRDV